MRRFAYGLLLSIQIYRQMKDEEKIALGPTHNIPVDECEGCKLIMAGNIRDNMPTRCPVCDRPIAEVAREMYYLQNKRELRR